ncbi:hypothetical protein QOZ80_9AG0689800 [Eleusine coracana subsp. coracana]|nr:hypothetical protein QOZ80_9AG0689800 [Eleusine coracana subsp. coracana]
MAVRSSSTGASSSSGSASTISAETETGYHVLTIEGYSQTKGLLGVGNSVKSGTFTVGGHTWCIRYYPDGFDDETADWICFDLFLDDKDDDPNNIVKMKHSFSLIDKAGDPVPPYTSSSGVCSLSRTTPSWGYHWLTPELESSPHLEDDGFRIRCDVTVIKAIRAKTTHTPLLVEKKLDVAHQVMMKPGGDVVVEVGDMQFTAHRSMLADQSPVFREMLSLQAADHAGVVHLRIDNMEAKVFEALLHFVYTGAMPEMEMARLLLAAADRYDMQGLKMACGDMLQGYMNESTVVDMLVLADKHGCHGLHEACVKLLVEISERDFE